MGAEQRCWVTCSSVCFGESHKPSGAICVDCPSLSGLFSIGTGWPSTGTTHPLTSSRRISKVPQLWLLWLPSSTLLPLHKGSHSPAAQQQVSTRMEGWLCMFVSMQLQRHRRTPVYLDNFVCDPSGWETLNGVCVCVCGGGELWCVQSDVMCVAVVMHLNTIGGVSR